MRFKELYESNSWEEITDEELEEMELEDCDDIDDEIDFDDGIDLEIDEDEDLEFDDNELSERVVKKKVVRGGKRKVVMKTDRKGYKIVKDPKSGRAKEERLSPKEARNRKLAQIKGARKRKGKSGVAQRKRAMSIKKRPT